MNPTRHTLQLPEVEISYLEWKSPHLSPQASPLLLLHGLADNAVVWSRLGEKLAPQYHIIAPDLRGHGESSKPDHGYLFQNVIEDLEALMVHLHWENAHILGHSWAGKLAPIWAKVHPEKFRSMLLVDPIFITKLPGIMKLTLPILYRKLDCLKCMGPFSSLEAAQNQAKQSGEYADWTEFQQEVFMSNMEEKSQEKWGSKFVIPARNEMFNEVMEIAGLTEPISIPTLLIQPEKGVNRFDFQLKPYQTYLKNLTIKQVPGNHWSFLVAPETFNQTVANYLEEITHGT